ncbi:MAG: ATP synthase F1 subunit gamma [Bdellovibrionales bacterium]|jgi:F-type H+-transporting ATPase subunit gamma|nr:ATP synthase F1 subunit gamma [Bdellovibrionales bacterium]MBT3525519.1 ATP synthase F1 subunit gamma [Bdellovibrionales bacterium]MBT7667948.1 ATP synthase F1 subunit gamma [Bdellovibrionales bacterium]MBT7766051.1 ATP synthase F1 subunit gamma [Bdellovibrionales bacterium]
MANIKDLKKKVKSTTSTHKITLAMKLVSAAKLAKAQTKVVGARPYSTELNGLIKSVSALVEDYQHPFLQESDDNNRALLLVLSADRGLCGGYNSQLGKEVLRYIKDHTELDFQVLFIGKKVKELISKSCNAGKQFQFDKSEATLEEITQVGEELAELFSKGEYGRVYVAYNHFKSIISFIPTVEQLLPISLDKSAKEEVLQQFPFDFKYDPSPKGVLDNLVPESYATSLFTAYLNAVAAEHGSRMSSMDSATKNCEEAIQTLTLKMNKLRQAAITTELIEVVSGAESLNG